LDGYVKADPSTLSGEKTVQWAQRGHGDITYDAWRHWDADGEVDADDPTEEPAADGCAKCHSAASAPSLLGFRQFANTGANPDPGPRPLGLDCVACHGAPTQFAYVFDATVGAVEFPSGESVIYDGVCDEASDNAGDPCTDDIECTNGGCIENDSNLCMSCHQGRYSKFQVDEVIAATDPPNGPYELPAIHSYAAGAILFGTDVMGGYEYATKTYVGQNTFMFSPHPSNGLDNCVGCHMNADPLDDKNHTFLPKVTDCNGCHNPGDTFPTLNGSPKNNYDDIQTLFGELLPLIEDYAETTLGMPIVYADHYPWWCNAGSPCNGGNPYVSFDAKLLKATYNYQLGQREPGGYIHNGDYVKQLLIDSILDLDGTPSVTRP
jgi:hypothetical protein